jgi:hypothetical protein
LPGIAYAWAVLLLRLTLRWLPFLLLVLHNTDLSGRTRSARMTG